MEKETSCTAQTDNTEKKRKQLGLTGTTETKRDHTEEKQNKKTIRKKEKTKLYFPFLPQWFKVFCSACC